jgi:predicted DNA-binding transcriptional regulator YafY
MKLNRLLEITLLLLNKGTITARELDGMHYGHRGVR